MMVLNLKDKKIIRGMLNFELFIRYVRDIRISQANTKWKCHELDKSHTE